MHDVQIPEVIINALLQLAGAAILAIGTWAIGRVVTLLGLKNSAQATANLDDALQKAVTYGLQQSKTLIMAKGWDSIEVRNQTLAAASTYMLTRFQDTLKATGTDMEATKLAATVTGALDRAFPAAVAIAAASPGTPPANAPAAQTSAEQDVKTTQNTTIAETHET